MLAFSSLCLFACMLFARCCAAPTSCQSNSTSEPCSLQANLGTLGTVQGTETLNGAAQRFTLPFAQAPVGPLRFANPQPISGSLSQTSMYDASKLPRVCMQVPNSAYNISNDNMSEDCLYLTLYRPAPSKISATPRPILVWVHGGSFVTGSSSNPGLDGSHFASTKNLIVVLVQYRLGMFGFFSPNSLLSEVKPATDRVAGNQGLRDLILALQFVRDNASAFGGDPSRITLAGQSSGAHLVRTLLSIPEAQPLFHRAILHSDPANFGTQSLKTSNIVSSFALTQSGCRDLACLRAKSASDILSYSSMTVAAGNSLDVPVAPGEVWRPFVGLYTGPAFEISPASSAAARSGKALIITTTQHEAGSLIGQMLEPSYFNVTSIVLTDNDEALSRKQLLMQTYTANRGRTVHTSREYSLAIPVVRDGLRKNLERILTQSMFSCAAWYNARRYALAGTVYLATFQTGLRYPSNENNSYCKNEAVCHEDDILILFTDPASLEEVDQRSLVNQVQSRWSAFIHTGNPNINKAIWQPVSSNPDTLSVLQLTSSSTLASQKVSLSSGEYAGCARIWTSKLKFDWQLYA